MSKKIDIRFTKHPGAFGLAYHPGEKGSFEGKQAKELVKAGVAELVETDDESDLPEDLPGRDAIIKAKLSLEDLEKLEKLEQYQEIEGVGKKTAEALVEYFKPKRTLPALPEDLPSRDAIMKAGLSLEDLKQAESYVEIEGVDEEAAEALVEYFKPKE